MSVFWWCPTLRVHSCFMISNQTFTEPIVPIFSHHSGQSAQRTRSRINKCLLFGSDNHQHALFLFFLNICRVETSSLIKAANNLLRELVYSPHGRLPRRRHGRLERPPLGFSRIGPPIYRISICFWRTWASDLKDFCLISKAWAFDCKYFDSISNGSGL